MAGFYPNSAAPNGYWGGGSVTIEQVLDYAIRNSVSYDFAVTYSIGDATAPVSSVSADAVLDYSIGGSVSADMVLTYTIGDTQPASVTVPASRIAKFGGRSRVVVFSGSKPVPYAKGPLDELYIIGNFSKDLVESNTTIDSVAYDSKGVAVLAPPVLQNGFPVVKLGALDQAVPRMYFTFRVTLANGEQIDGTIELTALDDHKTFFKDPDDRRFWVLDFGGDATFGGTTLSTVSAPVVAGVTSLMTPAVANNQATVKVGGLDLAEGAANTLGLWANFANTERIYRTIDFKQEDH